MAGYPNPRAVIFNLPIRIAYRLRDALPLEVFRRSRLKASIGGGTIDVLIF